MIQLSTSIFFYLIFLCLQPYCIKKIKITEMLRVICLIAGVLLPSVMILAQPKNFENPRFVSENKLEPRSTFYPFSTEEQAMEGNRDKSEWIQFLNGDDWKFSFSPDTSSVP